MIADLGGRRVLIVEDEGMVAMLLEDMLTELGHDVIATVNKLERAVQLIAETAIDFAILDVNLDGEHTYSLADLLRARDIPFVFATGYSSSGLSQEWRSAPMLQKPFQAQELSRVMRDLLAGRAGRSS